MKFSRAFIFFAFIAGFLSFGTPAFAYDACPSSLSRILSPGMTGGDVKVLQTYLNNNGFPLAETVEGSKGNETSYFGPLTEQALSKFQSANNIPAQSGSFDSLTRAFLGCEDSPVFTRDLSIGMTGSDVKELQKFLNENGFSVAEGGVGSKGNETSYFGPLTQKALKAFQESNPVITPSGTNIGIFSTATREVVNASISANPPASLVATLQEKLSSLSATLETLQGTTSVVDPTVAKAKELLSSLKEKITTLSVSVASSSLATNIKVHD